MPPPLLVVTLLFRSRPEFSALSHVIDAVSLYADASVQKSIAKASKCGSLTLLNRIWDYKLDLETGADTSWSLRRLLRSEPWYQASQANASLVEAVKRQDMQMIRWIFDHFPKFWVLEDAVEEAAAAGNMEILTYFLEKDIHSAGSTVPGGELGPYYVICWGNKDMATAAAAGHQNVVEWLQRTAVHDQRDDIATMKAAMNSGNIDFVEMVQRITYIPAPQCSVGAASRGHLELLQWLQEQIYMSSEAGTLLKAAENGHLDVVQWLIEQDWSNEDLDSEKDPYQWYDWDRSYSHITHPTHVTSVGGEASLAIHAASVNGHLEVAKYLHARVDTPLDEDDEKLEDVRLTATIKNLKERLGQNEDMKTVSGMTMLMAAKNGFMDVVQWLYAEFHVDPTIDLFGGFEIINEKVFSAMDFAAINGHFGILQYLHEIGEAFEPCTRQQRKRANNFAFDIFYEPKPLKQTTAPSCTTRAMDGAAAHGHLDIVRWLHESRTEGCTSDAIDLAARNGHLEIAQWLHSNRNEGCTKTAMDDAATGGHLSVVKWLYESRSEGCSTKAMDGAASGGHLEVVKWLNENRSEGCTVAAMDDAAACGALEVVKWLSRNRTEGCTTAAMDEAARGGHIRVIRWLHENRAEGCTTAAMDNAALSGEFEVVLFLHKLRTEGPTTGGGRVTPSEQNLSDWIAEEYPYPDEAESEEE